MSNIPTTKSSSKRQRAVGISRFNVRLYDFSALNLAAINRNGTADPYLDVDFDGFKTFCTAVQPKTVNPKWNEDVHFLYETRKAHKLDAKRLKIRCYNKGLLSMFSGLIGECAIDLKTVFSGPIEYRLPLRVGNAIKGELVFKCEVEQVGLVEINLDAVQVQLPKDVLDIFDHDRFYLKYWFSKEGENSAKQTPQSSEDFGELQNFYFRATFEELMAETILFEVKQKDEVIASCSLPIKDHNSFEDLDPIEFRLPLEIDDIFCRVHQLDYPDVGMLRGIISYAGFPKYLQMESGYCTDTGIYYALFKDPNVRYIPNVYIHGVDNIEKKESNESEDEETSREVTVVSVESSDKNESTKAYPFAHLTGDNKSTAGDTMYPFAHMIPGEHKDPERKTSNQVGRTEEETNEHDEQPQQQGDKENPGTSSSAYPFANFVPKASNSVNTNQQGEESAPAYPFAHLGPQKSK